MIISIKYYSEEQGILIDYFLTVGGQIFTMFLIVLTGFVMYKARMLTETGIKEMSVLLLKVVTPIILMVQFQRDFDIGLFGDWISMFIASAITFVVAIVLSIVMFPKKKSRPEEKMSIFLPNNGFLAFPLMQALAGEFGIYLGSTSVIIMSILQWTYGLKLLCPQEKIDLKKILFNPGMIGVVLGMLLFISPVKLPRYVFGAAEAISSLNTPIAMICLGGMLAQTDLKSGFLNKDFYKISLVNLIIMPIIMLFIFKVMPLEPTVKLVAFICSVTPAATAVSMMAQLFDGDYRYAANAVVINTAISAITMPILLTIGKMFLGY